MCLMIISSDLPLCRSFSLPGISLSAPPPYSHCPSPPSFTLCGLTTSLTVVPQTHCPMPLGPSIQHPLAWNNCVQPLSPTCKLSVHYTKPNSELPSWETGSFCQAGLILTFTGPPLYLICASTYCSYLSTHYSYLSTHCSSLQHCQK